MARMIPGTIHPNVRSNAERRLFDVIRDAPGTDEWVCLHSLGLAKHATKRRGEIDFLLLTRKGVFVLEVKGGRVSRANGVWTFMDRFGNAHQKNESPFDQASSAMFALEEDIRKHFSDDAKRSRLLFGCGVLFPDIEFDAIGPEADRRQVYDARNRRQPFTQFIDRLAEYWRERDARQRYQPTSIDVDSLAKYLRGDFDLVQSLGVLTDSSLSQLIALEKEQYVVLDAIEQFAKPRMLVQGAAGTGKTLLAVESAKREARKGDGDVLLLCFNRLLATFLDCKLKAEHRRGSRVVVKSIYSLLSELIDASPFAGEFRLACANADQATVFHRLFPDFAVRALVESNVTPFKTLVVDEAQDVMTQDFLDIMDCYVEGGLEAGRWWMFCDVNNQAAVFGAFEQNAFDRLAAFGHQALLPTNRRNTKPVAGETVMLTKPKIRTPAVIEGIPVTYSWYDAPAAQPISLSRLLKRLTDEQILPGRITVLSPRSADQCCAAKMSTPTVTPVTQQNVVDVATGACATINYCSISSFKGLENDFIVLTDIEDLTSEWWRSVIYVGMSRARVGLRVLLAESLRPTYERYLHEWMEENNRDALTVE